MTKKNALDNFSIRNNILHSGINLATLEDKDRNFITALSRGLCILEAFDEANPKLGLADLSKKTGLSKSTVFRLVHTLRALGYIIPIADENKYTLGPKVLGLGFAVLSSLGLREIAQPYLLELSRLTQETVNLAVLDGWKLIYVERIKTQQIVNINLHVGSRLELYNTAMGRVLAAFQNEAWLSQYLKYLEHIPEAESYRKAKGRELMNILEEVRKNDFAVNNEELTPGLRSVAAPVRDRAGEVAGAVNIAVSSSRYSLEELMEKLIPPLQQVTQAISSALGYDAPTREQE
ncbi:MAG: helix-turn-helix domain-containing protein [Candidatus Aminicenantes bacterium]|nr:helix-turn-helix domain-containing protein [Candidatus Aminicenantes bacterium]